MQIFHPILLEVTHFLITNLKIANTFWYQTVCDMDIIYHFLQMFLNVLQ